MKHLSVLVIALFLSTAVFASQTLVVEGVIEARAGKPVIRFASKQIILHPHDQHVARDLNRLRPGDFLSGYGVYDSAKNTLDLQTIETVGLKNLLGRWQTHDGQVFDFRTFDRLLHYSSLINEWVNYAKSYLQTTTTSKSRELSYTLAPDSAKNRWAIFVADQQALLIGYVQFSSRGMLLTLINPNSGRVIQKFVLRPMYNK
jgi:hypothetical protein